MLTWKGETPEFSTLDKNCEQQMNAESRRNDLPLERSTPTGYSIRNGLP